ncbi:DNA-protecting protein DprA [Neorhizobium galegae]|uniref:DNA-processing protein DprA n=1 Tax=Neorhizobium galegae TaxID=399 RepID=UPI0021036571|nr:DNA-processing protein DprA [Neorhizobium galegae]MCQ1779421.1 DNA-protecting protein DprA [Neorhizobium galegae]MCQ1795581.1 DNA-protecting protein DprA [Neorhizobium galegae]
MLAGMQRDNDDAVKRKSGSIATAKSDYTAPTNVISLPLGDLLDFAGRPMLKQQEGLFKKPEERDPTIFVSGEIELLKRRMISVIGARLVSEEGRLRASRISRLLAGAGVVVTSGLAKGVDTIAHTSAIDAGGRTVSVIGTPLDRVYPAENRKLQQEIYERHLLISQFHPGQRTFQSDFPKRNRLMAALSDGSIIVEASDTSGTLHQASECIRLGRWLFIMRSVVENPKISWPKRFLDNPKTVVLTRVEDILSRIA